MRYKGEWTLKQLLLTCCSIVCLTACQPGDHTLKEVENLSKDVVEVINADTTLQLISDGKTYYVVYHTTEDVKASSTIDDGTYQIQLDTTITTEDKTLKEYIYTFESTDNFDSVTTMINGKETAFDTVIGKE